MTLRCIDWKQVTLHMRQIHTLQQVVLSHRGLFIDRPLNVQVVLIDQRQSFQAASQGVQGKLQGRGTSEPLGRSEQIIVAGQALKNTDHSDYLFNGCTQSALTLAKHLRDVQDEVQLERVPLTTADQCATAYQGKWLAVDRRSS